MEQVLRVTHLALNSREVGRDVLGAVGEEGGGCDGHLGLLLACDDLDEPSNLVADGHKEV